MLTYRFIFFVSLTVLAVILYVKFGDDIGSMLSYVSKTDHSGSINDTVASCQSPACHDTVKQLEQIMNTSVHPCDDFYEFVCGGWTLTFAGSVAPIRRFLNPVHVINKRMEDVLDNVKDFEKYPKLLEAVTFYNQCRQINFQNESTIKDVYDKIKVEKLERMGGWPLISPNWNESNFDLERALFYMQNNFSMSAIYDITPLFSAETSRAGKMQIGIENLLWTFGRLAKLEEVEVKRFRNALLEILVSNNIRYHLRRFHIVNENWQPSDQMEQDVVNVKIFAEKLSMLAAKSLTNPFSESYTLEAVRNISDHIDWLNYFKGIFGYDVINNTQVVFVNVTAIEQVNELLKQTPKRTIANYVIWRFVALYTARFSNCLQGTYSSFTHALGSIYVKRHVDVEIRKEIGQYFDEIRTAFDGLLDKAPWVDETTLRRAKLKLHTLTTHIAYPPIYDNETKLKSYYEQLHISHGNDVQTLLDNVDAVFIFEAQSFKLDWKDSRIHWLFRSGGASTNAYYYRLDNSITLFYGMLNDPFYHQNRPLAMNYGSIGYFIGHEFMHAFDTEGRVFDEYGERRNWLTEYSTKSYDKRAQCLMEKYAMAVENSTNATEFSKYSASENIADVAGLQEAYEAFKAVMKRNTTAKQRLPGSLARFTPEQLFFISFASSFCAYVPDTFKPYWKYLDQHSMDSDRVTINMMNSRQFADAFNCPTGSRMNPVEKCYFFE